MVDPTGARAFELPAYSWLLRKARLFPSAHDTAEGKRPFLSATAGTILATLLAEARGRGALPGLSIDFGPSADSAGQSWAKVLTIAYEPGIDVLAVLDNLAEQGVVDWTTRGRTLRVFNADTALARDLATGDSLVDLRLGRDVVDAPDTATLEDLASAVYVKGDGAARLELTNPNAPTPWGRWEAFITHGGVRDEGTMRLLAEAELDRTGRERVQVTRGLAVTAGKWAPLRDYRPGDHVLAPGDGGTLVPLRVRQITLTRDQAGALGGNLVLNDRFVEREIRLARRTAGIVGGSTADGGSGARPAPEGPDPRVPAAPAGLIVASAAYLDSDGAARGQITATWGTVDTATDGTTIEVAGYEVYQRPNTVGLPWSKLTETTHPDNSATASPYDVGTVWAFKVRAISRAGVLGAWSDSYAVTIAGDADAPPTPSAPILSTRLGVIHVEWDGLGSAGETMPPDFSHLDVWMNTGIGEPAPVNQMEGAGSVVVTDQPYNALRAFWFTARDRSGNTSPASAPRFIATQPLVGGDVIGTVIRGDNIVANSVTADRLAVGSVTASAIAANAVTADKLTATAIDGKTITGATVRTSANNPRVQLDSAGLRAWNSSGTRTVDVSATTGAADIAGTLRTGISGVRAVLTSNAFGEFPGIHFQGMAGAPGFEPTVHGREDGTLWLLSAEQAANSSGRADLILRKGGGWYLGRQFGDASTAVSLNASGDGRLNIDGILPFGMSSNRLLGFGVTHINPGAFSVRIDYGSTISVGTPIPHCSLVTGAPQDGVTWGVSRWDRSGFQFNWSRGAEIDIHWLIVRAV
ncbi:hypothetical protein ACOBQX_18030 [Actinokineospora sp. G85]|uniref:hypothetical protein n=1 Tax=Actinokineospora sp. G85 TaxID=3406626 RepID=UPI003C73A794